MTCLLMEYTLISTHRLAAGIELATARYANAWDEHAHHRLPSPGCRKENPRPPSPRIIARHCISGNGIRNPQSAFHRPSAAADYRDAVASSQYRSRAATMA